MRPRPARAATLGVAPLLLAVVFAATACSGGNPTPSPSPTPDPSGAPAPEVGFRLRVTPVQALPPKDTFTWTPQILITDDLVAVTGGAIPMIFPGPLALPLIGTQLTEVAWDEIVKEARDAGLLSGETDFTGGALAPGAQGARLQIVADGVVHDLNGDPSKTEFCGDRLCQAEPGTPQAFATFVSLLGDLKTWIGEGVGGQGAYTPEAWAILVGPAPADDQGLAPAPLPWPFSTSAADFGKPVAGEADLRCGSVTGDEARAFSGLVVQANQLTSWRDPKLGKPVGMTLRPILPGDGDPCAPLVGA